MSLTTRDTNNDTIPDIYSIDIEIFDNPNTWESLTFVLPITVYIDGQMSFLMNDYIIFAVDGSFSEASIIGDLTIKQKRLINQK